MAEIKNYVSKYSGDQLDAAIAVLGSLETMFFPKEGFKEFTREFDKKMSRLNSDVKELLSKATAKSVYYERIDEQSNNG